MKGLADRVAGAPISWGVCEAPGWGVELPPERVLAEMSGLGLRATELGPTGYLGKAPEDVRAALAPHGLRLIGGFLPVPMHACTPADLDEAAAAMDVLVAGGSEVVVLAARSGDGSYEHRVHLDDSEWAELFTTLGVLQRMARERGLRPSLHPHVGTAVEDRDAVLRVLDGSDVPICLDTGHLLIGGTDPADLTRQAPERIAHTHLKDVDSTVADKVRAGRLSYTEGVAAGMYRPLGTGDVDVESIVQTLQGRGYDGWYTLEQDTILTAEPRGEGPVTDVRTSADHVRSLLTRATAPSITY
jgi:inosose dehydratase